MRRKIQPEDITFTGILIDDLVVKPGKNGLCHEEFSINRMSINFRRHYHSNPSLDEEYYVTITTKDWAKKFYAIQAEFQALEFPESDYHRDKTHYHIRLRDGSFNPPEVYLSDHPRITASKKILNALKRIAAIIPDGWPKPYALDNLG